MNSKFWLLCLLFFTTSLNLYAQNDNDIDTTVDDEAPSNGFDKIWRSSDLEGEVAVLRSQRRNRKPDGSAILPEGSQRVGCICMDYIEQKHIGRGACGGHNGVRFWVYELPNGDTARIATLRHEGHPDTLSDTDILRLAAYKRYERLMAQKQLSFYEALEQHPEWLEGFAASKGVDTEGHQDTVKLMLPPMPYDNSAQNTLLYSISVMLGSGMVYIIKKLREREPEPNPIEPEKTSDVSPEDLI